jgi:acetyl-CoA synthase
MSKIIASAAIRGGHAIYAQAEAFYEKAKQEKGAQVAVGFPDTAYFLPMAHAMMGELTPRMASMSGRDTGCR